MDHYRLPNQHYQCGNAPNGTPCPLGPIGSKCSNSHSDQEALSSCTPLRTFKWWSQSIQLATALIALFGISLAWSNLGGRKAIAPGSLSRSHAQLLTSFQAENAHSPGIDEANRCAACHPGSDMAVSHDAAAKQSELCLKCHVQDMPDAKHGSPHDLHGRALEQLLAVDDANASRPIWGKLASFNSFDWHSQPLECSQCHREHRGGTHDLKEMTSQRCQACHREKYQSFASDHAEFKDYPYGRAKSIAFDHAKHQEVHFTKKGTQFDCRMCHLQSDQVGVVGRVFRSVAFEQACASCHAQPIKSAIQDGLIVLQIPSFNCKELLSSGSDIGKWPEQASLLTDGVIPPVMRLLIESEPGGPELLSELPASGRLVELDPKDERSRVVMMKLASMTKQLLRKLANEGQPGFRGSVERLIATSATQESVHSISRSSPWLDQIANGMPPDLFRAAWNEWFETERPSPIVSQINTQDAIATRPSPVRFSSTIKQAEVKQADDDLLSGPGSLLKPKDDDLLSGTPSLLQSPNVANSSPNGFKDSRPFDQLAYGGWMIDRQRMAIVYVPKGHADEWLSRWIELEEMRPSSAPFRIALAQQCRQCHQLNSISAALDASPVASNSWLDDKTSLQGQLPTKQALTWSVAFRQANESSLQQSPMVTAERSLPPADQLNACWKSVRRSANIRPITKFDHTPHLTLPSISDCRSCHLLNPTSLHSKEEFAPMLKSQCASCHQANAAGDSCTQCHNYHVALGKSDLR